MKRRVYAAWDKFSNLDEKTKKKYWIPELNGQRGYTPDNVENSGEAGGANEVKFRELRDHFMVGPNIPEGHPILVHKPYSYFVDNIQVEEVPELIPSTENLLEELELFNMKVFEGVAQVLGMDKGYFSSRIAWGDSVLRLHHYPAVSGEIIKKGSLKGVNTLSVKNPEGETLENVVRAGRHTDVDF